MLKELIFWLVKFACRELGLGPNDSIDWRVLRAHDSMSAAKGRENIVI